LGTENLIKDARFASQNLRVKNRQELDLLLNDRLKRKTVAEWVEELNGAGVACGPIYKLDQVFADPQMKWANLVREVPDEKWEKVKVLRMPVSLNRTPPTVRTPAPAPGGHTFEVLASLGYTESEIQSLAAAEVIVAGKK
jgi:crotonobetainyl-CoA:carnitine CoA-transferase CaiB-like acyl-CoA transferase